MRERHEESADAGKRSFGQRYRTQRGDAQIRRPPERQAVRVGQAFGYELVHVNSVEPQLLALASESDAQSVEKVDEQLLYATTSTIRSDLQRPSPAQDIAKERKTEIDFINGLVAETGRKVGKPVNAHER